MRPFNWGAAIAAALAMALPGIALAASPAPEVRPAPGVRPMMTALGVSVSCLLHHAYAEAVQANQANGLGLPEMANNPLQNARVALAAIDALRVDAKSLDAMLGQHAQGAVGAAGQLVTRIGTVLPRVIAATTRPGGQPN